VNRAFAAIQVGGGATCAEPARAMICKPRRSACLSKSRLYRRSTPPSGGGGTPQWMSSHANPGNRAVIRQRFVIFVTVIREAPDT
jgi:hypothetical protein